MKSLLALAMMLLASLCAPPVARAGDGRTNINPALLYAQAIAVMPDQASQDLLMTNDWRGRELTADFNKAVSGFDNAFRLLRHAARQQAPCDWGYDLSAGPELLLPSLAKAKAFAQVGRLRFRWHLENGRPDDARDDWLAAYVLGRQLSKDGILISALVQIAIENIMISGVAENWFRLGEPTIQQILDGVAAAPARGSIARCVPTERLAFKDWLARKIRAIQSTSRDEAEALARSREVLRSLLAPSEGDAASAQTATADSIIRSAGGTTAGLLRQLADLDALYDEATALMAAPYEQFDAQIGPFNDKIRSSPNQFAREFFPAFEKCRRKEFSVQARMAMVSAALAYRQSGESGLNRVSDPVLSEPFQFRRIELDGVDRGFELRSRLESGGAPPAQIFVEKDGPPFHLDGPKIGQPLK